MHIFAQISFDRHGKLCLLSRFSLFTVYTSCFLVTQQPCKKCFCDAICNTFQVKVKAVHDACVEGLKVYVPVPQTVEHGFGSQKCID